TSAPTARSGSGCADPTEVRRSSSQSDAQLAERDRVATHVGRGFDRARRRRSNGSVNASRPGVNPHIVAGGETVSDREARADRASLHRRKRSAIRGCAPRAIRTEMTGSAAFWSRRSVLVTGATGLVGSHLVAALLRQRADVTVFVRDQDRRSALFRNGDIDRVASVVGSLERADDVERAIAESECSVVFHLAAQTIVGVGMTAPVLTFESNIRGTYHVLEARRRH